MRGRSFSSSKLHRQEQGEKRREKGTMGNGAPFFLSPHPRQLRPLGSVADAM